MTADSRTQKSRLQLGLPVGDHRALVDFHLDDPSKLNSYIWLCAIDNSTIQYTYCRGIIILLLINIIIFSPTSIKPQALNIVLSKV